LVVSRSEKVQRQSSSAMKIFEPSFREHVAALRERGPGRFRAPRECPKSGDGSVSSIVHSIMGLRFRPFVLRDKILKTIFILVS
jgi:hypothetical protein